jgi:acyl-coenzyme A synthetase/AMP-(fatty) acid ligase
VTTIRLSAEDDSRAVRTLRNLSVNTIQDGVESSAVALRESARRLAVTLKDLSICRAAVLSPRADVLIAALLACEEAGCEVFPFRGHPTDDATLSTRWGIDAIVSEQLEVLRLRGARGPASGFAVLLATSGTTGPPKVARHAPHRLMGLVRAPRTGDVAPTWLLTFQPASFAGVQVLLTALAGSGRLVATTAQSAPALARTALEYRVTHVSGTPSFWRAFLLALGREAAGLALKQITLGGELADNATLTRLRATYPAASISHIYASTEAGALFAVQDCAAGFPSRWLHEGVNGVLLRVRDGVLEVRSPRAMEGYLLGSSRPTISEDGWLVTHDLVEVRGDRVLFLGRADAIINVGGGKVAPDEVEAIVLSVDGVAEVRVSGTISAITGHVLRADVVLRPGAPPESVRRAIIERARAELEAFKVPRIIRFVEGISNSASGKKDRSE